jgi:predicted RNA polymerase sigma factor
MVHAIYSSDSRHVLATLIRLLGDFDAAEEALYGAFVAATEQWARVGTISNPHRSYRWLFFPTTPHLFDLAQHRTALRNRDSRYGAQEFGTMFP